MNLVVFPRKFIELRRHIVSSHPKRLRLLTFHGLDRHAHLRTRAHPGRRPERAKPFFYRGKLYAWLTNTGHGPDMGGMVPGGFSAHATEIEQEGLRLPPVKLYKKGELDPEILSILMSNIRISEQRIGDIKAQAAALAIGERRLTKLLDRHGQDTVDAAIEELKRQASVQTRAVIAAIPEGE